MITSNAGAEFSTKTTIIVALAANHRKMRGSNGSSALLRGRRTFPDKTQLITQRNYESELRTPTTRPSERRERRNFVA